MKCFLLFLLFLSTSVFGQKYSFVEYSTAKGLPQSQVTSIAQDQNGYLWVATLGGLAKFNGKNFISYTRDNGLANNKITVLTTIKNQLWIGHEGGISVRKNGKFDHWNLPKESKNIRVSGFVEFGKSIYVATNGDGFYQILDEKIKRLPLSFCEDNKIRDVLKYKEFFYIATRIGLYKTADFRSFILVPNSADLSISDIEIHQNSLIITTFNDGVFSYSPHKRNFVSLSIIDKNLFPDATFSDHLGQLWVSTAEGLLKIGKDNKVVFINESNGLPMAQMECVFEDKEQNMWFGSGGKGLIYFPGEQFVYFNESTGLPTDLILNVNQDLHNNYWISTLNKGIVKQEKNQYRTVYDKIKTVWTSAMNVNGMNWFGTEIGLLSFRNDQLVKKFGKENGLQNDKITSLYRISKEKMFVGGSGGLMLYEKGMFKDLYNNEKQTDIGTIRDMEIVKNELFLGCDKGLYKYINGKIQIVKNFSQTVFCLVKDEKNQLWIGSDEGLFSYDNSTISNKNFASETASKFINFLSYDNHKLYVGTNNGLYFLRTNNDGNVSNIDHYGIQEGILNLETNINSGYIDKSGNLWFGTAEGLVQIRNPNTKKQSFKPQLILQNILINYQKVESKFSAQKLSMSSSKNNISFEFDGISLSNPEDVFYQYWLQGAEDYWSPKTTNPTAIFTGLRSGEYVLLARAIVRKNAFSEVIKIPFIIRPPFYATWWFILASAIVLGLSIWQIFKFRIHTERQKNEKETIVFKNKLMALEQQSLNASMNRHFIFNSLNSIQYFINTQDKVSANKFLTNFAKLIRKNLDASNSDGNFIPLSKELERIELYMSLEAMRFKDRFHYSIVNHVESLDEQIMIPAMLLQPFIENSIVHGILPNKNKIGEIQILITQEASILLIQISDNGVGISKSLQDKNHISEGDHKSQGMEITAKRISLIKEISNKDFEIIGPKDKLDENRLINGTIVLLKIPVDFLDNPD